MILTKANRRSSCDCAAWKRGNDHEELKCNAGPAILYMLMYYKIVTFTDVKTATGKNQILKIILSLKSNRRLMKSFEFVVAAQAVTPLLCVWCRHLEILCPGRKFCACKKKTTFSAHVKCALFTETYWNNLLFNKIKTCCTIAGWQFMSFLLVFLITKWVSATHMWAWRGVSSNYTILQNESSDSLWWMRYLV